jgi:hypothetical protein
MGTHVTFTKQLATAHSAGIAASQSVTGGNAFVLNGSNYTNYLSTTSSAAAAVGAVVIPMTATTGVVVGQTITDTTTSGALVAGTTVQAVSATSVTIWPPVAGSVGIGSGDTIVFPGLATIDTATAANSAIGRRVVIAYSGSDTTFTIVGTNTNGATISETITGVSGAVQSNMDFVTVSSITPVGSITGATAGTNGVGSSQWWTFNWRGYSPMNLGMAVELVSGAVNFTVQHTYDDPNNLRASATYPLPFNDPIITGASNNIDAISTGPITASRVLINSGTGEIRVRFLQAGAG